MRREQVPTVDGGTIDLLVPETETDVEALRRREEQGEQIDDRFSFGDNLEPARRKRRRGQSRSRDRST